MLGETARGKDMLTIRETASGKFAVDDGEGPLLVECPCCGLGITEAAAKAIVANVTKGKFTMAELREAAALRVARRDLYALAANTETTDEILAQGRERFLDALGRVAQSAALESKP